MCCVIVCLPRAVSARGPLNYRVTTYAIKCAVIGIMLAGARARMLQFAARGVRADGTTARGVAAKQIL